MHDDDFDMDAKRICQLPPIRVSERLEQALMRGAAADDRKLSEYIHRVLHKHCFGHVPMVRSGAGEGNDDHA